MKKLTLSIGLLAGILSSNAQDTTCTYFKGKNVYEFNYQTNEIIGKDEHIDKFYDINVKYGDVLCLHLSDRKLRVRKVIITFFDGVTRTDILDSKDYEYYSPLGTVKVSVGKPYFMILK
jgi:hypothetical protein